MSGNAADSILIVDDVPDNIRLLSEILKDEGFAVRQAVSGNLALMSVAANPPDLILLDINMPEMDGYEVCRRLKDCEASRNIPVIFLSALDDVTDKVKSFDLGAVDYVSKPFAQAEIVSRIRTQLSIAKLNQQLANQNQVLETALQYWKENQAEIIQQEKMAALENLIAGVAHEINNPVSFIIGNLSHAQDYFQTLKQAIQQYRTVAPTTISDQVAEEIEFTLDDFPSLMDSMQVGAERIEKIVQALKTFSHHGEAGVKEIDLQQTLDSLLILLKPRFRQTNQRPEIKVDCQYQSLSPVACEAKLIGQVFLDLLENAIDSIDVLWASPLSEEDERVVPSITLRTQQLNPSQVQIAIADTGGGIPDEIQTRVYEPFFSTKPVGAKGLGLTTSYRIVTDVHHGTLTFHSSVATGTEFIVTLPVTQA
ncbi:sensor histidine kinase [Leptolyngbya iicbica]|uniref:histidine kinase n=2 Tax=Cyanophyceae TaxID=3028117 RepID=A0A4Q7EHE3_9CYAN|nr:response regulator [Leptolyngbya sp. LK]RZM82785.1 hybrid sensor histidine kinase/response regulator [Leptolyngbya sp. LK]